MNELQSELQVFWNGWLKLPSGDFINMDHVVHVERSHPHEDPALILHRTHGDADSFFIIISPDDIAAILDWLEAQATS